MALLDEYTNRKRVFNDVQVLLELKGEKYDTEEKRLKAYSLIKTAEILNEDDPAPRKIPAWIYDKLKITGKESDRCMPYVREIAEKILYDEQLIREKNAELLAEQQKVREEKDRHSESREIVNKALDILKNGDPLGFFMDQFHENHSGHDELARCITYAYCVQSSGTSKGIQPETTGAKGSGKTHAVNSTLHLFPEELVYETTFSPKSLYYQPPKQGSIIYSDEDLDPDLVKLVKRMMTNFQRDTRHTTILEKSVKTFVIPKRQVFLSSTVLGDGDDQFSDRTVQVGISNTDDDDRKYAEFEARRRQEGRPEFIVTENVLIARQMMRIIREREFEVTMPRIDFAYLSDRRLINIFYDLVEASAILNFMKRGGEEPDEDGITRITPTNDDISAALSFEMFRFSHRDMETRLTKAQVSLHNLIQSHIRNRNGNKVTVSEGEIVDLYGKSQQAVRKLLYGKDGTPQIITGGLLDRTPWYVVSWDRDSGKNIIECEKTGIISGIQNSFAWIS
jgi:hypothetical protein